ncbi:MAG TPA: LacI family DNA-binding transcriptional regulator [Bryobacteraceae bacterium]
MGRRQSTTPTVKDVAKRASVSIGTVSRVLNDHADVRVALRDRVQAAIRELGYQANGRPEAARRQSRAIGFLLCNGAGINPIHAHLLLGIEQFCWMPVLHDFHSIYVFSGPKAGRFRIAGISTAAALVNCVIVAGMNHPNFLLALKAAKIRYVLLGNHVVGLPPGEKRVNQVRYDDYGGAFQAAQYLIQLRHRNIWVHR